MLGPRRLHELTQLEADDVESFDSAGVAPRYTVDDIYSRKTGEPALQTACNVRTSGEALRSYPVFMALKDALRPIFSWIADKVSRLRQGLTQESSVASQLAQHMPKEFKWLRFVADVLPAGQEPAASPSPFCGFVLNINCVTGAHRDTMDQTCCVCFAMGDWEGGHLVLDELGLVFPMQPGEVIVFDSTAITHFNMHYLGYRISIVMHTDKHMKQAEGLATRLAGLGLAPAPG